ncbi:hypothetical protein BVX98_01260, partial [bacterium F11]
NGICNVTNGRDIVYDGNTIVVKKLQSDIVATGINPGSDKQTVTWRNNIIESDQWGIKFGHYSGKSFNALFENNTFIKGPRAGDDYAVLADIFNVKNTTFTNTTLVDGGTLREIKGPSHSSPSVYQLRWSLNVTVKNASGQPIGGANVTIANGMGKVVHSGVTSADGTIPSKKLPECNVRFYKKVPRWRYDEFGPYTVTAILGNQFKTKTVILDAEKTVPITLPSTGSIFHIITAAASEGGVITPSGPVPVAEGSTPSFTFTPNITFEIQDVQVDNASIGAPTHYPFPPVTRDQPIYVSYQTTEPTYQLLVQNGSGSGWYPEGYVLPTQADVPPPGKLFSKWTGNTGGLLHKDWPDTYFVMSATTGVLSITATYRSAYPFPVTVVNGTGSGDYLEGDKVTIVADPPPDGKTFDRWTGADIAKIKDINVNQARTTFTMPASTITITASYRIGASNSPPQVMASAQPTSVWISETVQLKGSVWDDGRPETPGSVTTFWSKVSGPGWVDIFNPSAQNTSATFTQVGEYVLRLTAFDGELTGEDSVTINVTDNGGSPFPTPGDEKKFINEFRLKERDFVEIPCDSSIVIFNNQGHLVRTLPCSQG